MLLENIKPSPALADFISCYRIAEFVFSSEETPPYKAYPPRPQECLQFFPRDLESVSYNHTVDFKVKSGCVITGQHTQVNYRHIGKNFLTVLVVFKPGMLYRLTGVPASELINHYFDAKDILQKEIVLINEQLHDAVSYKEMLVIIEKYLLTLVNRSKQQTHIVSEIAQQMLDAENKAPIDYFMKEACLCRRQFDRKFREWMGINPKLYGRIARFDQAFRMKNRYVYKDWLTIAVHCGYYDYQHLSKEYKDFTGLTPNDFLSLETKAPERFFGDVEM
ncbi:helix-turn-helix domain-containing protein [Niabella sp.]|uniref:helix-turn-helix domain-containing protein n=1 Tax=Niabella sp. TaxID=1962976 RepID=UPI002618A40B|nr:helix-turn-helix domain-containing protein [Niabella sp.]